MGNKSSKKSKKSAEPTTPKPRERADTTPAVGPNKDGLPTPTTSTPTSTSAPSQETQPKKGSGIRGRSETVDPSSQGGFSIKKAEELFTKYREPNAEQIGPSGIGSLCTDLSVNPEDVTVLIFAYHLGAQEMGYFSREEFLTGLQKLNCDSISKIKAQFKVFEKELDDPAIFKEIYRFGFFFAKEADQKILDLQMASDMLQLLMGDRFFHSKNFLNFLTKQTSYKAINLDQWMSLLEFCRTVSDDFSNYDESSAWPVLLDEYVVWAKGEL
eukprot:TRINITY_DN5517_c0_g2_i1.p1 TRINITY_DN5517_c0_g2~~TRINITY_DN5517_c0_g2_i1.p1  ORF type:complete len:270 (-),score=68.68 TRINITY_DN5517_c0_g2_i1:392-1201(-)